LDAWFDRNADAGVRQIHAGAVQYLTGRGKLIDVIGPDNNQGQWLRRTGLVL
jgi:hypothetical protein